MSQELSQGRPSMALRGWNEGDSMLLHQRARIHSGQEASRTAGCQGTGNWPLRQLTWGLQGSQSGLSLSLAWLQKPIVSLSGLKQSQADGVCEFSACCDQKSGSQRKGWFAQALPLNLIPFWKSPCWPGWGGPPVLPQAALWCPEPCIVGRGSERITQTNQRSINPLGWWPASPC